MSLLLLTMWFIWTDLTVNYVIYLDWFIRFFIFTVHTFFTCIHFRSNTTCVHFNWSDRLNGSLCFSFSFSVVCFSPVDTWCFKTNSLKCTFSHASALHLTAFSWILFSDELPQRFHSKEARNGKEKTCKDKRWKKPHLWKNKPFLSAQPDLHLHYYRITENRLYIRNWLWWDAQHFLSKEEFPSSFRKGGNCESTMICLDEDK